MSPAGLTADHPQVAAAANGDATVVWRQRSSTGFRVMASWRVDGGDWSVPRALSRPSAGGSAPQVAMNGQGAVVVWKSAGRFRASRHPSGQGWTRPVPVTGKIPSATDLDLAMDRRGDITVVWRQQAGKAPGWDLVVRAVRRPAGGHWGDPVRLSGSVTYRWFDMSPQVAMGGRGETRVIWLRPVNDSDDCRVMIVRRTRGGSRWSAPARLDVDQGCTGPLIAMNGRGDTAATWQGSPYEMQEPYVVAAVRPAGGRWYVRALPSLISGRLGGVALDAAGNATVAWDEAGGQVLVARRPVGGPWESPVTVIDADADAGSNAGSPSVAMGGEGTTTVVWTLSHPASDSLLQGAQRPTAGTWDATQSLSEGPPAGPWRGIPLAMDARGHTVVVWTEANGATTRVMVTTG